MATNPGTVLQVVCNFNMLYIGCQYQVIKKVKKKRKADLPYLSFLQDEIGNTHIFFWPYENKQRQIFHGVLMDINKMFSLFHRCICTNI